MPTTPKLGLPYPDTSALPNIPAHIQALAEGVDAYGVLGGKRRTSPSANITTVESTVVDTQNLAFPADSSFLIDFTAYFTTSVAATDANMTIRLTSVSGTIIAGPICMPGPYTTQGNYGRVAALYKTTAAELNYFCGTMIRQAGTGNIVAVAPTHLIVYRLGPASLIGDY